MSIELITTFPPSVFKAISGLTGLEVHSEKAFKKAFRYSWKRKIFFGRLSSRGVRFLKQKFGLKAFWWAQIYRAISFGRGRQVSDCFFIPSRNGFVIIDMIQNSVYKLAHPIASEPELISSERIAAKSIPDAVPRILKHGQIFGEYSFLCSEYVEASETISYENWTVLSEPIIRILFTQYREAGISLVPSERYLAELESMWESSREKSHHKHLLEGIYLKAMDLLKSIVAPGQVAFKVHAHGDLVPNNILISSRKIYIFDWANGGQLNLFYDLLMQEFYKRNSELWANFMRLPLDAVSDAGFFSGWCNFYIQEAQRVCGHVFDAVDLRFGIITALLELSFKNHAHYQYHSVYHQDGADMLSQAKSIIEAIR